MFRLGVGLSLILFLTMASSRSCINHALESTRSSIHASRKETSLSCAPSFASSSARLLPLWSQLRHSPLSTSLSVMCPFTLTTVRDQPAVINCLYCSKIGLHASWRSEWLALYHPLAIPSTTTRESEWMVIDVGGMWAMCERNLDNARISARGTVCTGPSNDPYAALCSSCPEVYHTHAQPHLRKRGSSEYLPPDPSR